MLLIVILFVAGFFAVRGLYVLGSVPVFRQYWIHHNSQAAQNDAITVVALGDSTIQGIGGLLPTNGVAGRVARYTQKQTDKKVSLYNFSLSGGKIADVAVSQLQHAKAVEDPDLIIIAVGPNDLTADTKLYDFIAQYKKIITSLPSNKIVLATIPPLDRRSVSDTKIQAWNNSLRELAEQNKVQIADVYAQIYPRRHNQFIYGGDFFHPSTYGYRFWEKAFEQPVATILQK